MNLVKVLGDFHNEMAAINGLLDPVHQVHEILFVSDNGAGYEPWMSWTNLEQSQVAVGDYFVALAAAINADQEAINTRIVGIENMPGSLFDFGFCNNLHSDSAGNKVEYFVVGNDKNGEFADLKKLSNWSETEKKLVQCFNKYIDSLHKKRMET